MRRFLVSLFLVLAFGLFLLLPEERRGTWLAAEGDEISYEELSDPGLDEDYEPVPAGPRQTLSGHVRLPNGDAVGGVVVRLDHAWVEEVRAVTDLNGYFELTPDEPRGELDIHGTDWFLLGGSRVVSASQTEDYLLVVAPPLTVLGSVVDADDAPVKDAEVTARTPSGVLVPLGIAALPIQGEGQTALTNRAGRFRLARIPDVEGIELEVRSDDHLPATVPLPSADAAEAGFVIRLDPLPAQQ